LETNESDVANWRDPDPVVPDSEEAPAIGPWVAVEPETYNPETAAKGNCVPDFSDFELTNSYDEALRGWKEERESESWKELMEILQKFHLCLAGYIYSRFKDACNLGSEFFMNSNYCAYFRLTRKS